MNVDEIIQLVNAVNKSNLTKFKYSDENSKVEFEVNREVKTVISGNEVVVSPSTIDLESAMTIDNNLVVESAMDEGHLINSPVVGTFYASKKEGGEPLIKVGDTVTEGQVIGIVEAMKLMNEITAEFDCEIVSVVAEDAKMVEYGQKLFKVKRV